MAERHLNLDPELESRVEYRCQTLEEMRDEKEVEFDCVVASEVVEHVADLSLFLHLLSSSVKVRISSAKIFNSVNFFMGRLPSQTWLKFFLSLHSQEVTLL